ncbi:MAG: hypothetical protein JW755_14535 [Candidatus Aminicenantes bacterium]|nr:hypothetical protein [Candidatus Aminicenantes bacterium]
MPKVVFEGKIANGQTPEKVKNNLHFLLKCDERKIDRLFVGGPVEIMNDVHYQQSLNIQTRFELAGAQCKIIPLYDEQPAKPFVKKAAVEEIQSVPIKGQNERSKKVAAAPHSQPSVTPESVFEVQELDTSITWKLRLFPNFVEFMNLQNSDHFKISRDQAAKLILLKDAFVLEVKHNTKTYTFMTEPDHSSNLQIWLSKRRYQVILDQYRAALKHHMIFIAPDIPAHLIQQAVKAYAYAYNGRDGEEALALIGTGELGNVTEGLFLTNKNLYLHTYSENPIKFELGQIQTITLRKKSAPTLCVNDQEVFSVPPDLHNTMIPFVEMVKKLVAYFNQSMICPKCGLEQKKSAKCAQCGIFVQNYMKRKRPYRDSMKKPQSPEEQEIKEDILVWPIYFFGSIFYACITTLLLYHRSHLPGLGEHLKGFPYGIFIFFLSLIMYLLLYPIFLILCSLQKNFKNMTPIVVILLIIWLRMMILFFSYIPADQYYYRGVKRSVGTLNIVLTCLITPLITFGFGKVAFFIRGLLLIALNAEHFDGDLKLSKPVSVVLIPIAVFYIIIYLGALYY